MTAGAENNDGEFFRLAVPCEDRWQCDDEAPIVLKDRFLYEARTGFRRWDERALSGRRIGRGFEVHD